MTPPLFRPSALELTLTAGAIWALCLMTFSLPGRAAPQGLGGLDIVALGKLAVRAGTLVAFLFAWRSNPDHDAKRRVFAAFAPAVAFLAWAALSTLWSPLKTVSVGQTLGLSALLMLSAWVALSCRASESVSFVLNHLCWALFIFTVVLLAVHVVRPDLAGLDRELELSGGKGVVHPTVAGSTAGIGLLLTLLTAKSLSGIRPAWMVVPVLGTHSLMLLLANSRTALAMTAAVGLIVVLRYYSQRTHALALVTTAAALCLYIVLDPGFVTQEERLRESSEYLSRGQTQTQLSGGSGRVEMWTAVWEQVQLAPVIGHGYFVTSHNGKLNVWDGPSNHTAHNLALQILVSTGVIGSLLFAAAGLRFVAKILGLRSGDALAVTLLQITVLMGVWYAGWGQTCISFMGPVLPEAVVFFVLLGLAVGQAARQESLRGRRRIA